MSHYRTGHCWGRTIVREGTQPPDSQGRRPDDEIVGTVLNGIVTLQAEILCPLGPSATDEVRAERIVALLNTGENTSDQATKADPNCVWPDGVCTCGEPEGHP